MQKKCPCSTIIATSTRARFTKIKDFPRSPKRGSKAIITNGGSCGSSEVKEKYVTGDAEDYEKFLKYAEVVPYAIGNPIYHWTHLELKRFFGIEETLSPQTAASVYARANKTLQTLTARQMILKSNVKAIFTTDDPADDLKWHELLKKDRFAADVRPDVPPRQGDFRGERRIRRLFEKSRTFLQCGD